MELRSIGYKSKKEQFEDRFAVADGVGENGSFKLTADGCYQRHNISREEMQLTERENQIRNWECPNNAEREERSMQNQLWKCFNQLGYKLLENESAEALIERAKADGTLD